MIINRCISNLMAAESIDTIVVASLLEKIADKIREIPVTRHPLGFIHYDLRQVADLPQGAFARLHIWDKQAAPPDPAGNIHDHTWTLTSAVLLGKLRDKTFKPELNPTGDFAATSVHYGDVNKFHPADRYDLIPLTDRVYGKGETYRIESRIVHESDPLDQPTVTLVLGIPDRDASLLGPLILSRGNHVPAGTALRKKLEESDAVAIIEKIKTLF